MFYLENQGIKLFLKNDLCYIYLVKFISISFLVMYLSNFSVYKIFWICFRDVQLKRGGNRYNDASLSYNKINHSVKSLLFNNDEIKIVVTKPELIPKFSPIGKYIVFHKQVGKLLGPIVFMQQATKRLEDATCLFSMLSLSLHIFFGGVFCFPGFPSYS